MVYAHRVRLYLSAPLGTMLTYQLYGCETMMSNNATGMIFHFFSISVLSIIEKKLYGVSIYLSIYLSTSYIFVQRYIQQRHLKSTALLQIQRYIVLDTKMSTSVRRRMIHNCFILRKIPALKSMKALVRNIQHIQHFISAAVHRPRTKLS